VARAWGTGDIADLRGRTAVVTGANSGLGNATAAALAAHGASVVLACRNAERAAAAQAEMRARLPEADVTVRLLDLADLGSVRRFAGSYEEKGIDLLVNNAGVMAVPHRLTADGFELQFGTNHLGHYALTGLLLPALLRCPAPRVVTVSSVMHVGGRIDFGDLQHDRHYRKWGSYTQSKLANLLFAFELDRRAKGARSSLVSLAAHPGYAATNLQAAGPWMEGKAIVARAIEATNRVVAQSAATGALPVLYAATTEGLRGGEFVGPHLWMWGHPAPAWCSPAARNQDAGRRLWEVSEGLTGVSFDALGPGAC
jgi:NAD(P)-dependent dehydrogenase (short-subunit alcohol dehydrogenase family)